MQPGQALLLSPTLIGSYAYTWTVLIIWLPKRYGYRIRTLASKVLTDLTEDNALFIYAIPDG